MPRTSKSPSSLLCFLIKVSLSSTLSKSLDFSSYYKSIIASAAFLFLGFLGLAYFFSPYSLANSCFLVTFQGLFLSKSGNRTGPEPTQVSGCKYQTFETINPISVPCIKIDLSSGSLAHSLSLLGYLLVPFSYIKLFPPTLY